MKMQFTLVVLVGIMLTVSMSGCKGLRIRTQKEDEKTGLFKNDPILTSEAFSTIVQGKTTVEDMQRMGLNLQAKNITRYEGIAAIQATYGTNAIQDSLKNLTEGLTLYSHYTFYKIPLVATTNVSNRIYLHKKETRRMGFRCEYIIVTSSNLVVYAKANEMRIDTRSTSKAFFQGPVELVNELGNALRTGVAIP